MADYRANGLDFLAQCEPYYGGENVKVTSKYRINNGGLNYTKYPIGYLQAFYPSGFPDKYMVGGNREFAAKGHYPTVTERYSLSTVGTHTIVFESSGVYALINGSSSNKVEIVPSSYAAKLIFVGVFGGGGGGGGGGTSARYSGCGGGGGAGAYGLFMPQNFIGLKFTVRVGRGGSGGSGNSNGVSGGETSITAADSSNYRIFGTIAGGGKGGQVGYNGQTNAAAGGSISPNTSGHCLSNLTYSSGGGGGGDGTIGSGCSIEAKRYTPAAVNSLGGNSYRGGSAGYGGGGGAGPLGNGGAGGGSGSGGNGGGITAGGGGGAYSWFAVFGGASGGNGCVEFYY